MNSRGRNRLQTLESSKNEQDNVEILETKLRDGAARETSSGRVSRGERKKALEKDIDKLKKKLRQEENIQRALKRASTRTLGAFPRLPPFLPPYMIELIAEVAVLEEEIVRLEQRVVHFRKNLDQEAVNLSFSNKVKENLSGLYEHCLVHNSKVIQSKLLAQNSVNSTTNSPSVSVDFPGKENQCHVNWRKDKKESSAPRAQTVTTSAKKEISSENTSAIKNLDPRRKSLHSELTPLMINARISLSSSKNAFLRECLERGIPSSPEMEREFSKRTSSFSLISISPPKKLL